MQPGSRWCVKQNRHRSPLLELLQDWQDPRLLFIS